jgi:hypothetical protein
LRKCGKRHPKPRITACPGTRNGPAAPKQILNMPREVPHEQFLGLD